jgi:hypothetical protein
VVRPIQEHDTRDIVRALWPLFPPLVRPAPAPLLCFSAEFLDLLGSDDFAVIVANEPENLEVLPQKRTRHVYCRISAIRQLDAETPTDLVMYMPMQ